MGKGDNYRPVDQEKYDEGYKKAFGCCKNSTCPSKRNCTRWLDTPFLNNGNVFDFNPNETGKCDYYIKDRK